MEKYSTPHDTSITARNLDEEFWLVGVVKEMLRVVGSCGKMIEKEQNKISKRTWPIYCDNFGASLHADHHISTAHKIKPRKESNKNSLHIPLFHTAESVFIVVIIHVTD